MRSLNVAFSNIRRSPYQSISAVMVLTLTYFVAGVLGLVGIGSEQILRHFETKPQVIAYLKDQATQEEVVRLQEVIEDLPTVAQVKYVSKQEALEIYKEIVGNDPMLLGTVTDLGVVTADILPASLEISVNNPDSFGDVVKTLSASDAVSQGADGKKDIDFPQDVVTELTIWTRGLRLAGIVLLIALSISSLLTIFTVIGMKISSKKFEISTMKLLGAKWGFISSPYVNESMIYGLSGSVLGWIFVYIVMLYASPFLAPKLSGIMSLPIDPLVMLSLLGVMSLMSIVLGWIAGVMASRRFLQRA